MFGVNVVTYPVAVLAPENSRNSQPTIAIQTVNNKWLLVFMFWRRNNFSFATLADENLRSKHDIEGREINYQSNSLHQIFFSTLFSILFFPFSKWISVMQITT
jgi:hypothetical protein